MVKVPFSVWPTRFMMAAILCGFSASQVVAQTGADSASGHPRRQNAWLSAGLGVTQLGAGESISGWYSNNRLVLGVQGADGTEGVISTREIHAVSFQVGIRSMGRRGMALIAVGPAKLGGWHNEPGGNFFGHTVDDPPEVGAAASAEATIHVGWIGIGLGLFAAGGGRPSPSGGGRSPPRRH